MSTKGTSRKRSGKFSAQAVLISVYFKFVAGKNIMDLGYALITVSIEILAGEEKRGHQRVQINVRCESWRNICHILSIQQRKLNFGLNVPVLFCSLLLLISCLSHFSCVCPSIFQTFQLLAFLVLKNTGGNTVSVQDSHFELHAHDLLFSSREISECITQVQY